MRSYRHGPEYVHVDEMEDRLHDERQAAEELEKDLRWMTIRNEAASLVLGECMALSARGRYRDLDTALMFAQDVLDGAGNLAPRTDELVLALEQWRRGNSPIRELMAQRNRHDWQYCGRECAVWQRNDMPGRWFCCIDYPGATTKLAEAIGWDVAMRGTLRVMTLRGVTRDGAMEYTERAVRRLREGL